MGDVWNHGDRAKLVCFLLVELSGQDGDMPYLCGLSHAHVAGAVADKHGLLWRRLMPPNQLLNHERAWFALCFLELVRGDQIRKDRWDPKLRHGESLNDAWICAGCDAECMLLCEFCKHLDGTWCDMESIYER